MAENPEQKMLEAHDFAEKLCGIVNDVASGEYQARFELVGSTAGPVDVVLIAIPMDRFGEVKDALEDVFGTAGWVKKIRRQ
jgi:hypothetical protein